MMKDENFMKSVQNYLEISAIRMKMIKLKILCHINVYVAGCQSTVGEKKIIGVCVNIYGI